MLVYSEFVLIFEKMKVLSNIMVYKIPNQTGSQQQDQNSHCHDANLQKTDLPALAFPPFFQPQFQFLPSRLGWPLVEFGLVFFKKIE